MHAHEGVTLVFALVFISDVTVSPAMQDLNLSSKITVVSSGLCVLQT